VITYISFVYRRREKYEILIWYILFICNEIPHCYCPCFIPFTSGKGGRITCPLLSEVSVLYFLRMGTILSPKSHFALHYVHNKKPYRQIPTWKWWEFQYSKRYCVPQKCTTAVCDGTVSLVLRNLYCDLAVKTAIFFVFLVPAFNTELFSYFPSLFMSNLFRFLGDWRPNIVKCLFIYLFFCMENLSYTNKTHWTMNVKS